MSTRQDQLAGIHSIIDACREKGIVHRTIEDHRLRGRTITLNAKELVNFGSCSYLGLELDERVMTGAIEAVQQYGAQLSSSRAYLSNPLYKELESLLDELFQAHTIVTANTTLAHQSALPVLIDEGDLVIADHQVHATVRTAADLTRLYGAELKIIRHNDMERLENILNRHSVDRRAIWYLADGVYSMHGDFAPMSELSRLLQAYPNFYLYIDDAHGMSWTGNHGCGYVLSKLPFHPHMVVAISLNKSFGAGGGALILPTKELRDRVFTLGGPMIFTGPLQPASLGAAVASARIHLSDEIRAMQKDLRHRIQYFQRLALELELPIVNLDESPTQFLGMGSTRLATAMVRRLFERGLWTNIAAPPAVSARSSGVRAGITRHLELADLERLAQTFNKEFDNVLEEDGSSIDQVRRTLSMPKSWRKSSKKRRSTITLSLEHKDSIKELDASEWNRLFEGRGAFLTDALLVLEKTFSGNIRPEDNWRFHYFVVRDIDGAPVAATFFTSTLWKDDIFSSRKISATVENIRKRFDPYYLTSTVFIMGSLLTEGDHLYVDFERKWQSAVAILIQAANRLAIEAGAKTVAFRDLPPENSELDRIMLGAGFIKLGQPSSLSATVEWRTFDEYLASLTSRQRYAIRKRVLPFETTYKVELFDKTTDPPTPNEWSRIYHLYRNVHARGLELNVFPLPQELFHRMLQAPGWELVVFRGDPSATGEPEGTIHGFMANFLSETSLAFHIVGLDYNMVKKSALYKCMILQALRRTQALGKKTLLLGMGTARPKKIFGALEQKSAIFVSTENSYALDILATSEEALRLSSKQQTGVDTTYLNSDPGTSSHEVHHLLHNGQPQDSSDINNSRNSSI